MSDFSSPRRLAALRQELLEWAVEGVLIGSPSNRRWLSGFTGSAGWLLVTAEHALLGTDFRYWEQAADQAPNFEVVRLKGKAGEAPLHLAKGAGVQSLGVEATQLTVETYDILGTLPGLRLAKLPITCERLRGRKEPGEVARIRGAAAITDQAMAQVPALARPGQTEKELAWLVERAMREAGADALAFAITVASGPNSALPHHKPGGRRLEVGDAIVVDMGAELEGYKSDLSRTFYLGSEPSSRFNDVYDLVLTAQAAALEGARPGMTGKAIDALARDVIAAGGHGDHFGHSLGHSVGLDIHEGPRLSHLVEDEVIPAGAVITVEPGVYLPGWGGVRIEDLVLFNDRGIEVLSRCGKAAIIPSG